MNARLKIAFAALAFAACAAAAQTFHLPNNAGGEIVLTPRACPNEPRMREGYAYTSEGRMTPMCWTLLDGRVHVVWSDNGSRSVFRPNDFTVRKAPAPKQESGL